MEDKCHRNTKGGHVGQLKQRFSKVQTGLAAVGGAAGVVGLTVAAVLAPEAELVLLALPVVMGPGAVMSGHRFLNMSANSQPPCGGIKIAVRMLLMMEIVMLMNTTPGHEMVLLWCTRTVCWWMY